MDNIQNHLLPWIGITSKMIDSYHTSKFKEYGFNITKEQCILLNILSEHCGSNQNELAMKVNRDKTTITRLISTLEKKNYITRINSKADKRIKKVYLTTQGEEILNKTSKITTKVIHNLESNIEKEDINKAIKVLSKIQNNIDNQNLPLQKINKP